MLDVLHDYGSTFATSKQYQQFGLHQTQRKQPDAIIEDDVPLRDKEQPRYNRHPNLSTFFFLREGKWSLFCNPQRNLSGRHVAMKSYLEINYPSSHNHGSVETGCITVYLQS